MRQFRKDGFPMKSGIIAALAVILLSACQYRLGTGSGMALSGSYCVDPIDNQTEYRLIQSELQGDLVEVLRRHKSVVISRREEADTVLSGSISKVSKIDKERASNGEVIEAQIVVNFVMKTSTGRGSKTINVSNTAQRSSSGTFRIDRGGSENAAMREALKDAAEAAVLALSGEW